MTTYFFQIQSTLIILLLFYGLSVRKNVYLHAKIMRFAIIWDLLLVGQIEFHRGAILKASKVLENTLIMNIHVTFAITTVVLLLAMLFTGHQLLKGKKKFRRWHLPMGGAAMVLRLLTYITSFMVLNTNS
jgi:hypothetical protein